MVANKDESKSIAFATDIAFELESVVVYYIFFCTFCVFEVRLDVHLKP